MVHKVSRLAPPRRSARGKGVKAWMQKKDGKLQFSLIFDTQEEGLAMLDQQLRYGFKGYSIVPVEIREFPPRSRGGRKGL